MPANNLAQLNNHKMISSNAAWRCDKLCCLILDKNKAIFLRVISRLLVDGRCFSLKISLSARADYLLACWAGCKQNLSSLITKIFLTSFLHIPHSFEVEFSLVPERIRISLFTGELIDLGWQFSPFDCSRVHPFSLSTLLVPITIVAVDAYFLGLDPIFVLIWASSLFTTSPTVDQ